MKNLFRNAVVNIKNKQQYLSLLIILAPLLNFLSGINFDLHAPSLPAIAVYYAAPISAAKNTVSISLLGFAMGCILFGTLLDIFGRRPVVLFGLLIYTAASFLALSCGSINELLWVRFAQGVSVSSLSIGCRTIIIDNFTGHQFKVAILYTSLAFGFGPIIAPFVGGLLQFHFGWKANFIAYGVVAFVLMVFFTLFISESQKTRAHFSLKNMFVNYIGVLKHPSFMPGCVILGISQVQLLIYTTVGAFIIENILHRTAITYGNSALLISCGYLLGTFANRILIKSFSTYYLISTGFVLLFLGIMLQALFAVLGIFNLFSIIFPLIIVGFSNGFIFINIFTACLRSSSSAGVATALFTSAVMAMATLGTYAVGHIHVSNLSNFAALYGGSAIIQLVVFLLFFKKVAKQAF